MINSMTGYGRASQVMDGREISVEVRSVNHRYFEFSSRCPRSCGYLDERLKKLVHTQVSRGKIDVCVTINTSEKENTQVQINIPLASAYLSAMRTLGDTLFLEDDITLSKLVRFSDIFSVSKSEENEEEIWAAVAEVAQQATDNFTQMRCVEGKKLEEDILNRLHSIEQYIAQVEKLSPKTVSDYRDRMYQKLCEVLENRQIDEQRILTESAIFAEKVCVAEETVRLCSHISQFRSILKSGNGVGRKLDFLIQEFNREANTIGSKVQDVNVAHIVVEIKSEVEKIREQVQNLE